MKQWEDIVKERLEGYESTLPEGSYAQFQKLREGKKSARKKVYPLVWTAAAVVAASLVAVFFLRQPVQPEEGVQLVQQQPVEVQLMVADSITVEEPVVVATPLAAQAVTVKPVMPATKPVIAQPQPELEPQPEPQAEPLPEAMDVPEKVEETLPEKSEPEEDKETPVTVREEPFIHTGTPFIPENRPVKRVNVKVALPVAGGLLRTGALALLAVNLAPRSMAEEPATSLPSTRPAMGDQQAGTPGDIASDPPDQEQQVNPPVYEEKLLDTRHSFPLRLGVSARIPVWKNLYVTSGLEYSKYRSYFKYSAIGEKTQVAQYLGVPLRLDWVFPLGKLFDAYAGAGMQADFCLAATWEGQAVQRDKPILSLGAAGGLQMNFSQYVGLFVEPQLSWRIPMGNAVLQTYRTQHPWMFSLSAGVRINLENNNGK